MSLQEKRVADIFTRALVHHQSERWEEAAAAYRHVLRLEPRHLAACCNLGAVLRQQGNVEEAISCFRNAVSICPDDADTHFNLGNALKARGNWDEAIAAYRQALACKKDFIDAYCNLGIVLNEQGRQDEAVAVYQQALRYNPTHADIHFLMGNAMQIQGKLDLAIASYGKALVNKPDYAEAQFNLGTAKQAQDKWEEAVASYRNALAIKPDSAHFRSTLATALLEQGRVGEAVACSRQALEIEPDSAQAYCNLGAVLQAQGLLEEAIESYESALRLEPDLIQALNGLNNTLCAVGSQGKALTVGRKALLLKDKRALEDRKILCRKEGSGRPIRPPPVPVAGKAWIISFSLWGDRETYNRGAIENVLLYQKIFPDWQCRFYCDETVPPATINALTENGAEIVMMAAESGYRRYAWRFLVADDTSVGRYLCRDCDSRPSPRESAAIGEWVSSGKPFHVIRDHPQHVDLMLAGLWGGTVGWLPDMASLIQKYAGFRDRFSDQNFLGNIIWPIIRGNVLIHDSYYDVLGSRRFPVEREKDEPHVGACFRFA